MRLEIKGQAHGQPHICDQAPVKTLDTKAWESFLGWQYSMHNDSTGRGQLETSCLKLSGLPHVFLPLADFNLYSLAVISHNCDYKSFW